MDSPWDDDPQITREAEWTKISSEFTNTGYREGITAGKEAALQGGFNHGFVNVGGPLGRELGILRGVSSAILTFLVSMPSPTTADRDSIITKSRDIAHRLANISFADIAPRDLEAEAHAREHLDLAEREVNDKLTEKRDPDGRGEKPSVGPNAGKIRATLEDMRNLRKEIETLSLSLGLATDWA